jgi:hypothetical protein
VLLRGARRRLMTVSKVQVRPPADRRSNWPVVTRHI